MGRLTSLVESRMRAGAAALLLLAALLLFAGFAVRCGSPAPTVTLAPTATPTLIQASLLIEADESAPTWHRDIEAPKGVDGYELLETAVDGDLEADWFPEFRAHFVKAILGVAPEGAEFWGVFLWNEGNEAWEPLPVGADLFSVKDGHVMAWALVEYDADAPQLPVNTP